MQTKDFSGIRTNGSLPSPEEIEIPGDIADLLADYIESTNSMLEELEKAAMTYEAAIRQTAEHAVPCGPGRAGAGVPSAAEGPTQGSAATIRRILHKIKGESGMVGIEAMSEFCHQAEYAFEELDPKQRPDMLLRFKDWVCTALQSIKA